MSMLALVPDSKTVYPLLGRPQDSLDPEGHEAGYQLSYPYYIGAQYDASTTNLSYRIPAPSAGDRPLELTVSFLSPITPTSTLRQSIPASYISITAEGNFDVDFYMDINGLWVTGSRDNNLTWYMTDVAFDENMALRSWQIQKDQDQPFVEVADRAEWGRLHFTGPAETTYECGTSATVRQSFAKTGRLENHAERYLRRVMDEEAVFAFQKSFKLGSPVMSNSSSVLFTIVHIRDNVVQYASARGLTLMRPLWKSYFFSEYAVILFHYLDFYTAKLLAGNYSEQLAHDAHISGSDEYADIAALSARQVLGATDFSGTPENPLIFLKEISSNGNTQTVDIIFPAFPFFIYTNPRWLAYLLEPLLEHQLSGQYPNQYSMHDLGSHYPNLTGHADGNDEYMPVEECGDMLIMGLSLINSLTYKTGESAQSLWSAHGDPAVPSKSEASPFALHATGEDAETYGLDDQWGGPAKGEIQAKEWVDKSYSIWKQWTEYLVDESLLPPNQLCTDDFAGWLPLQTNLALKGIVAIKAMSKIAGVLSRDADVKYYQNVSDVYIKKWQEYAVSRDGSHVKLAYDWHSSWTTLYSLFADAMLCFHLDSSDLDLESKTTLQRFKQKPLYPKLGKYHNSTNFIPSGIYVNQSKWYELSIQKYGLPLDSRHLYTKSDWQQQVAAVASPSVKTDIIHRMAKWLNETETNTPFSDLYETEEKGGYGAGNRFTARPVVGSHFALLALKRACGGKAMDGLDFFAQDEPGSCAIYPDQSNSIIEKPCSDAEEGFVVQPKEKFTAEQPLTPTVVMASSATNPYELYRQSSIGVALTETLDDFITENKIEPQLAMKIVANFDKLFAEIIADKVKSRLTFKGNLATYRFCDDVWTFLIKDVNFKLDNQALLRAEKIKIVSCTNKKGET